MSRKIEVELTSDRGDGTWTWRAAGAKQPKGELAASLLYAGVKVGDVVRAEAEFEVDGIEVTAVLPPKAKERPSDERIEILGPPRRDETLVTASLSSKSRERDRSDRSRPDRGDRRGRRQDGRSRDDRPRDGRDGEGRGERASSDADRKEAARSNGDGQRPTRGQRSERERSGAGRSRDSRPAPDLRPKPKRLRPGRTHRNEVLATLPDSHKPIAEQVLKGGVPAVRQAVEKQNEANREAGRPEIAPEPILALAEQILPKIRTAEWRDRAEAALADLDELDLRDLRSVVVASDQGARDDESRAMAQQLREGLNHRVEAEHSAWLTEIAVLLADGRLVRALRLSSRPPKAGSPLPADLVSRLVEASSQALTSETGKERFATVLDALAYSPVRLTVTAVSVPAEPGEELTATVKKLAGRVPQVAAQFGLSA